MIDGTNVTVGAGQCIFSQGEKGRDLYLVKRGKLRVYKTEEGIEVTLDEVGPGAVIGEVAAIDGGLRSASVAAIEESELVKISSESLNQIAQKLPEWFNKIARILVQRLRDVDEKIDLAASCHNYARVAFLINLLRSSDRCEPVDGAPAFALSALEHEIADVLSLTLSDASVALDILVAKEVLKREKNLIVITDHKKLESIAQGIFGISEEVPAV